MTDIINWCEKWCGDLTFNQKVILNCCITKNTFYGVGRGIGMVGFYPLVINNNQLNIIDSAGYYQLASKEGIKKYL